MKTKITSGFGILILLLLVGCGVSSSGTRSFNSIVRQAIDVPNRFETPAGVTREENTCLSPLTDPRDGTKIIMQTAFGEEGVGDYEVPSGRYGVGEKELLRINCQTGEVLGIVKR